MEVGVSNATLGKEPQVRALEAPRVVEIGPRLGLY